MASINTVVLSGRLTKDLELKKSSNNISSVYFQLAVSTNNKNDAGEEGTYFIPCIAWRNNADYLVKYAHKGDLIGIEGTLQQRSFDKRDGTKGSVVDVNVGKIIFLNVQKLNDNSSSEPNVNDIELPNENNESNADLPF